VAGVNDSQAFREQLDTVFKVEHESGSIPLRLAEVSADRISAGVRQFSLFFHGSADEMLPQGTYSVHHHALGWLLVFIVPIMESNAERIVYQACFSAPVEL
jgi:hypothetical protein